MDKGLESVVLGGVVSGPGGGVSVCVCVLGRGWISYGFINLVAQLMLIESVLTNVDQTKNVLCCVVAVATLRCCVANKSQGHFAITGG